MTRTRVNYRQMIRTSIEEDGSADAIENDIDEKAWVYTVFSLDSKDRH